MLYLLVEPAGTKKHGHPGRGTALLFDSILSAIVSDLYWLWLGPARQLAFFVGPPLIISLGR